MALLRIALARRPGSTGTDWRVHGVFDLGRGGFSHLELTDRHGAEALERGTPRPGEIRIGERNYARALVLRRFRAEQRQGGLHRATGLERPATGHPGRSAGRSDRLPALPAAGFEPACGTAARRAVNGGADTPPIPTSSTTPAFDTKILRLHFSLLRHLGKDGYKNPDNAHLR